jgi:hypothetical protein
MVFPQSVTYTGATVTPEAGGTVSNVAITPANGPANEVTVTFAASNAQTVNVQLAGVSAGGAGTTVAVPLSLLLGDVNGNGQVTSTDISQAKAISGNPIERETFRTDVTINGVINSSDIGTIKHQSGSALPTPAPAKEEDAAAKEMR